MPSPEMPGGLLTAHRFGLGSAGGEEKESTLQAPSLKATVASHSINGRRAETRGAQQAAESRAESRVVFALQQLFCCQFQQHLLEFRLRAQRLQTFILFDDFRILQSPSDSFPQIFDCLFMVTRGASRLG
jgi:hypothetical protein